MNVPFLDLAGQHQRLRRQIDAALAGVIDSGSFVGGPWVATFEKELAAFMQRRHARGVANCTAALAITLRSLKLEPGDEVITTPHTAVATAEAVTLAGGRPVFADVDPRSWLIDPAAVEAAITPRTRAVIPVHLYGMPAQLDRLLDIARRKGLVLIEDCAQAQGARWQGRRVGSLGHAGCLSFFPSKNLGGLGDGGAVVTDDAALDGFVAMYRDHGRHEKFTHEIEGSNERLDALQAAVLSVKMKVLDEWNARRRQVADWYAEDLTGMDSVALQQRTAGAEPVWHLFVVRVADRDGLATFLKDRGIGTGLHYPLSLNLQPAFAWMRRGAGHFPVAERTCEQVLSLPMDPFLSREQVRHVGDSVKSFCAATQAV